MLKLDFKINKIYLLVHALGQHILPFPEWVNLKNYLWKVSPEGYLFLTGTPEIFLEISTSENAKKIFKESQQLLRMGLKRKEFKHIYLETIEYKTWLEKQWKNNATKIFGWLKEITGLILSLETVTVYITHPKLRNGKMLAGKTTICWGHSEDWKNYSLIYLTHELLHILVEKKYKDADIMHALIELLADNEIRIRLNKRGKYFKEGKFKVGHNYLLPLEKKILPYWKKFLTTPKKVNFFQLEKEIKKRVS